jgi:hypothetical protein
MPQIHFHLTISVLQLGAIAAIVEVARQILPIALIVSIAICLLASSVVIWQQLLMTDSAISQTPSIRMLLQQWRQNRGVFYQLINQAGQVFQILVPFQSQPISPTTPERTAHQSAQADVAESEQARTSEREPEGTVIEWLPPERKAELQGLLSAAFDSNIPTVKDFSAFIQLLEAMQQALIEYWGSLPSDVHQRLVVVSQLLLALFSNSPIETVQAPSIGATPVRQPRQFSLRRLQGYLMTIWKLLQNPSQTVKLLKQLVTEMTRFARTIQRLNDRDIKVAQFQQKLAQDNWNRAEQIERNQAAIAWIREQRRQDEAMTEEEANQAKADFEEFKRIIDEARPLGNRLYTNE